MTDVKRANLIRRFLGCVVFSMLPISPFLFVGAVAMYSLHRFVPIPRKMFLATIGAAFLGTMAIVLGPEKIDAPQTAVYDSAEGNMLSEWAVSNQIGVRWSSPVKEFFEFEPDGFWGINRIVGRNGDGSPVELNEITTYEALELRPGEKYTLKFLCKFSGGDGKFSVSFLTSTGHHIVQTKFSDLGGGIFLVSADYVADSKDRWLRPLDLTHFSGSWTRLHLGFPILKFTNSEPKRQVPTQEYGWTKVTWWLGICLLFLLLQSSFNSVFRIIEKEWISLGILGGVLIQVALLKSQSILAFDLSALPENANFLGHLGASVCLLGFAATKSPLKLILIACLGIAMIWEVDSRIAVVALLIGFAVRLLQFSRSNFLRLSFTILLFFFGVWIADNKQAEVISFFQFEDRQKIWLEAVNMIGQNPLTGVGFGNFGATLAQSGTDARANHAHNLFLQIGAEFGVLGLSSLLCLLLAATVFSPGGRDMFSRVAISLLLLMNLVDFTFFFIGVFVVFNALVAMRSNTVSVQV